MKGLVTPAAVEAGAKVLIHEQSSGLCELDKVCFNCDCGADTNKNLSSRYARLHSRDVLEAGAPFIAAEALRQAADQAEDNYYNANGYVDNDASEVCVDIRRMADELERGK